MSLILEALRRADAERGRGKVPGLHTPAMADVAAADARMPSTRRRRRLLEPSAAAAWAGGIVAAALVLGAGLWGFGRGPATAPGTVAPAHSAGAGAAAEPQQTPVLEAGSARPMSQPPASAQALADARLPPAWSAPTPPPAPARLTTPIPTPTGVARPEARLPAPAAVTGASDGGPATPPMASPRPPLGPSPSTQAQPAPAAAAAVERGRAPPSAAAAAADAPSPANPDGVAPGSGSGAGSGAGGSPAASPTPPAAASAAPVPWLADLPALRAQLPPLAIAGGMYSDQAEQRLLILNGQVVREGETIAPGLRLEQIRPRAAVFSHQGQRFALPM